MTNASSLAFPGSRALATWWRQLAPYEPRGLHVGYLFVHRVEAAGTWRKHQTFDPLLLFVLEALALDEKADSPSSGRGQRCLRLNLEPAILNRLLQSLATLQLVEKADLGWQTTEQGRAVLREKALPVLARRAGCFLLWNALGLPVCAVARRII